MHACPFIPSPYGVYKTKDGYISVSGTNVKELSEVLGLPNMAEDPRFDTTWKRIRNRGEMDVLIDNVLQQKTTAEWMKAMEKADIWSAPVNTLPQAFTDQQVLHNEMVVTIDSPVGPLKMPGIPYKLSKTPARVRTAPPLLGEHSEEILRVAGYSADEIKTFRQAEVV